MLLLLLACSTAETNADEVCAQEFEIGVVDGDTRSIGVQIPDDSGAFGLHVDVRWPHEVPDEGVVWPVVVVLQGGWDQEGTPVTGDTNRPEPGDGLVAIHMDLPGHGRSDGTNDRRGPESRAAVAAALRYATGQVTDFGGCTVATRTRFADPDQLFLLGASNGGNLAVATLADPSLDLPPVDGLITWETPVGPVFANVELGKDPNVYTPGSCVLTDADGVVCDFPEEKLFASPTQLCFDVDGDEACSDADIAVPGTLDPLTEEAMVSPALRAAADARGLNPAGYADLATADAWWADRDAARLAPELVAAWPDLPVMLIGSEEDHVLPWPDHPAIFGWGEALQRAGAFWTRLNPGDEYIPDNATPNEPNAAMTLADPSLHLLTEDEEDQLEHTLSAAVLELSARTTKNDW